jgi:putative oxidoreductase
MVAHHQVREYKGGMNQSQSLLWVNDMNANSAAAAAGRLLMSIIFLLSGFQKLGGFNGTVGYMASLNLPLPELAAIVAIVVECVGGLLVLVGYQTRGVGLGLAAWCVATALVAHSHIGEPEQAINFLKNLAMCGGFLQLVAFGGGKWSLDARKG